MQGAPSLIQTVYQKLKRSLSKLKRLLYGDQRYPISGSVFVQQWSFKEELVVIWNQVCLPRQPAVADDVLRSVFNVLQNTHTRTITQDHTEHTYSRNYSSAHQRRKEGKALEYLTTRHTDNNRIIKHTSISVQVVTNRPLKLSNGHNEEYTGGCKHRLWACCLTSNTDC